MSKGLPSRKAIAASEAAIVASLSNAGHLQGLLSAFSTAADTAPGLALDVLHALRRVFTKLFHDGVMSGSGVKANSGKSKAKADATAQQGAAEALASWLREQYKVFQITLFRCLLGSADDSEGGHDRRELAVAALSTFAHFTAHACSVRTQRKAGGGYMCTETVDWLLRRLLTCYSKEELPPQYRGGISSDGSSAVSAPPPADLLAVRDGALPASAAASLDRTLEAFRTQYCDDYDDMRLQACRAVATAARDKMSQLRSGSAAAATSAGAGSDPLALCPAPVFLRRAAGLLLDIALPPDEDAWAEAEHESLIADQWRPILPDLYKARAGAGAGAGDDSEGDDADTGPGAKRVKLYRGDDTDDSDDDRPGRGRGSAGAAKPAAGGAAAAAAAAAGAGAGAGGKNGKRPRARAPGAPLPVSVSDFGDEDSAVLPMAGSAGGAAAKRAAGRKKTPSSSAAAAPPRAAAFASGGAGDDDDDIDLDAIRLDDVAPAGGAASAAAAAAAPAAAAASTPRYLKLSEQRRAYCDAWLALLQLGGTLVPGSAAAAAAAAASGGSGAVATALPPDVLRRVLLSLPTRLLPLMPGKQPLLLADFLTACLDAGGVVSVLALESLFLLVRSHGLDYPRLYARTYALLTPEAVHARHRARFFKLLDMLLGSSALPAYLVAAFAKKALRLALTAASPYALFAIPFAFNCLKRHPACAPLLHKEAPADAGAGAGAGAGAVTAWPARADPFDPEASDPADARALESSLWEVTALATHYHAPTAYLARAFLKGPDPLARSEYDIAGEYAAQSSAALVAAELDKTVRRQGVTSAVEVPFHYVLEAAAPALDDLSSW